MNGDIIDMTDSPFDAKDAADRIRKKMEELNQEIGRAKRMFNIECKIQLKTGGNSLSGIMISKVY